MKKVGLITYYGENYGGMLQAYALQQYVKNSGYDCKIISNEFLYIQTKQQRNKHLIGNVKALLKNPFDYMKRRNAIRSYSNENAMKSARFQEFLTKNIEIDYNGYTCYDQFLQKPPQYDVYLCGSDQIWNPNLYHSTGFYFADFAPENCVAASYASSIGISSVTTEQADFMRPYLNKLDLISTRETDGAKIVEEITGKKARTVIDPTLLLNDEQWSKVSAKPLFDEPYIFCYLFSERDYIEKVKKTVKELTGMKLVCIPYAPREFLSDDEKVFDAGPAEFISLVKNASLVLTDSFHATVFSINLKTPFISLCRFSKIDAKGMNSRLTTILGALDLEDRLLDENDEIVKEILFDIDFEKTHKALNELRKNDSDFLKEILEYEKGNENA